MGETHDSRMSALARLLPSPSQLRYLEKKIAEKAGSVPPKVIKRLWHQTQALALAQANNGAGLEADQLLRYFGLEYNHRFWQHGPHSLPISFNVLEAFFKYEHPLSVFRLRPETDHDLSFTAFLDFVTSPEGPKRQVGDAVDLLEDGRIYSFTNTDEVENLVFREGQGAAFAVGAVSLIRFGEEVTVLMGCGIEANLEEETSRMRERRTREVAAPGKENLSPDPRWQREAVSFRENTRFWSAIAATRFDLRDRTRQVRYLFHDCGDSYNVASDDPAGLFDRGGEAIVPEAQMLLEKGVASVNEVQTLFEVCATVLFLPSYFQANEDSLKLEHLRTEYGRRVGRPSFRKIRESCPAEEKKAHRTVISLQPAIQPSPENAVTVYRPPEFRIETGGYWKALEPDQEGADKHGKPVEGRTWVHKRLTWLESDAKGELMTAARHAEPGTEDVNAGQDPGVIYVMRSAMHPKDVFKIGLTRRASETRAQELSRGSSVPDRLFVMHEWPVSNCREAEKRIHGRLDHCRLNPNREFFEAPFREIVEVVEAIVEEVDLETRLGASEGGGGC